MHNNLLQQRQLIDCSDLNPNDYESVYDHAVVYLRNIVNKFIDRDASNHNVYSFLKETFDLESLFKNYYVNKNMSKFAIKSALFAIGKDIDCMSFYDIYSCSRP